jgi:glycosyltransferase involved in cell wall biosynthesis
MREVYRVARHGAQVCIVAPYFAQGINFANPYHKVGFNEHTPRFWTTSHDTVIDARDYWHPHAGLWGLGESDNSNLGMDLRCVKIEFLYFPNYRYLAPDEQRAARQKYIDVCDQIVYHLIVYKSPVDEEKMPELIERMELYDPPYIKIRRLEEHQVGLEKNVEEARAVIAAQQAELDHARAAIQLRQTELDQTRATLQLHGSELDRMRAILQTRETEITQLGAAFTARENEITQLGATLAARETEITQLGAAFTARENEITQLGATLAARETEITQTRNTLAARDTALEQTRATAQAREDQLARARAKGGALANELAAFRIRQSLEREQIQIEFVDYTCFDRPRSPSDFCSELERTQIHTLLTRCAPVLVHTVTFIPSFGQMCNELKIPHISSQYAIDEAFQWTPARPEFKHCEIVQSDSKYYAKRWGELLGVEKFCAREVVPPQVFEFGQQRYLRQITPTADQSNGMLRLILTGTVQDRKRQLETIEAVGRLKREGLDLQLDIFGYTHFFSEYVAKCQERIRAYNLETRVHFLGFSDDVLKNLERADMVLSPSTFESFPSAIKEAMAAGVLVIATPVGGIPELIIDGVSGILCRDVSVDAITDAIRRALKLSPGERQRIIEQARRVARSEFHPYRAANDLFLMYNRAIELARQNLPPTPPLVDQPVVRLSSPRQSGAVENPPGAPQSHLLINRRVRYTITPRRDHWIGIDILIGTHNRRAVGELIARVYSAMGAVVRQTSVDLMHARDNDWLAFRFTPLTHTRGKTFTLQLELKNADSATSVSVYEANPPESKPRRAARRAGLPLPGNSPYCRMWYAD